MSRVRPSASLRRYLVAPPPSTGGARVLSAVSRRGEGNSAATAAGVSCSNGALLSFPRAPLLLPQVARVGLVVVAQQRAQFSAASATREAGDGVEASGGCTREEADDKEGSGGGGGGDEFHDPRIAILDAALDHVEEHGFSATALAAGAKECGFHSVATGMFPEGRVELVRHVMTKALLEVKRLSEGKPTGGAERDNATKTKHAEHGDMRETSPPPSWSQKEDEEGGGQERDEEEEEEKEEAPPSSTEKLRDGIRAALSTIVPYKSQWPHAMSVGALPQNAGATAIALAVLADELAFLAGDRSTDLAWYGKRGVIAGIYASTELFMLTDASEGQADTWSFLDRRLSDYEILTSSRENAGDVMTGVGTVAASLSSAAVSLVGPFLRQASKQVPGADALAQTAPNMAALASQALSLIASQAPHGHAPSTASGPSRSAGAAHPTDEPRTYPGAPERDPWSDTPGSAGSGPGKFEEELAREERELFGGDGEGRREEKSGDAGAPVK